MFAVLTKYSLTELAIAIVIVAALCALVWVALKQFQVQIPAWVMHVGWIIFVAFVVILAIRIVTNL